MPRRAWEGLIVAVVAAVAVGMSTDLRSPPRYDGAGYSVLALSLIEGRGYREIDRPGAPPHAHFPPGYPLVLAGLWSITGRSVVAAHALSVACTVAAVWLAWRWFRSLEIPSVATLLGLALAVNWTWAANGGAIQSEPLYLLLSTAALVLARRDGLRASLGLGALVGFAVLTRHVSVCLALAVVIDRVTRKKWREAGVVGLAAAVVVAPWTFRLASVRRNTQVGLLESGGLGPRVAEQALFYVRRLPDVLTGPFVEVATVFSRSKVVGIVATAGAAFATIVLLIGLVRAARDPRKRLAGLVPLATLPLLLVWPFTEAGRFLVPLVPCLLVGMVEGVRPFASLILSRRTPHPTLPRKGGGVSLISPPLRGRVGWGDEHRERPRIAAATLLLIAAVPYSAYALVSRRAEAGRRTHADFDAACGWIAREAKRPGPVLTRHPGEVFWQTGRTADAPASGDLDALARQISDEGVAYLLVDPDRFANAPKTPLARFATERAATVRRVFGGPVEVYEVRRDSGP